MPLLPADALTAARHWLRLRLPMAGYQPAGFPSPADDFALNSLDLNEL